MTPWIITAAVVLSAAWRFWLGGTPRNWPFAKGLTAFKYIAGLALAGGTAWMLTHDWRLTAVSAVGYLAVWRIYGHGPMLQVPLGPSTKDFIYALIPTGLRGTELGWWGYGFFRYVLPCAALGLVIEHWRPSELNYVAFAGVVIVAAYRVTYALRNHLPYGLIRAIANLSSTPNYDDSLQPYNVGHPIAGAALTAGICLAIV